MSKYPALSELNMKRILSIDYGHKFTGIAMVRYGDDPFPLPWGRIAYKSDQDLLAQINQIIEDEFVDIIVLGIPFFTDGTESKMTKTIKAFLNLLETNLSIPIYWVDETLTTFEAEQRMQNDPRYNFQVNMKKIDELCAAIILEEFLKYSSDA